MWKNGKEEKKKRRWEQRRKRREKGERIGKNRKEEKRKRKEEERRGKKRKEERRGKRKEEERGKKKQGNKKRLAVRPTDNVFSDVMYLKKVACWFHQLACQYDVGRVENVERNKKDRKREKDE